MTLDRVFSPQDMDRIRRGVVPEAMEDKWFIYWKEGYVVLPAELDRLLHLRRPLCGGRRRLDLVRSGRYTDVLLRMIRSLEFGCLCRSLLIRRAVTLGR